jgi:hypothetical protein
MGAMMFGHQESIDCIANVPLRGAENEQLCIAHKTSSYFFIAGVYAHDDGYVLGIPSRAGMFYPWPAASELAEYQSSGMLPRTLPAYSVWSFEYVFGFSLWIILAFLVAGSGARALIDRSRRRNAPPVPASPDAAPAFAADAQRAEESPKSTGTDVL